MTATATHELTAQEIADRFGPIPLRRVRLTPYPATDEDILHIHDTEGRLYELIDGILLEKTMGLRESFLAMFIGRMLGNFVEGRNLGAVTGPDGMMRLTGSIVRIPDVAFMRWEQFPGGRIQATPIPELYPDLAVEVLSAGNTAREMDGKLADYFAAGTSLVWFVDPRDRTVTVFASPDRSLAVRLAESETLDGGSVLPGFALAVRAIFAELA